MPIKEAVRLFAEPEISAEALKDQDDERGCGSSIEYHHDRRGNFVGYTVTVTTDRGFTKTFPRVAATEPPDSEAIHQEFAIDLVEEIKKRRAARRVRIRPKGIR